MRQIWPNNSLAPPPLELRHTPQPLFRNRGSSTVKSAILCYGCVAHTEENTLSALTLGQCAMETTLNHDVSNETFPINANNSGRSIQQNFGRAHCPKSNFLHFHAVVWQFWPNDWLVPLSFGVFDSF